MNALIKLFFSFFRSTSSGSQTQPSSGSPPPAPPPTQCPWMVVARRWVGFKEKPGNRGIDEFVAGSKTGNIGDPWCAIFVNYCLETAGVKGSRSAMARSFEKHPGFVRLDGPAYGAIGTLWRQSKASGLGHVFFYLGHNEKGQIIGLGGNQRDGVTDDQVQPQNRFNGYYWPKNVPLPKIGRVDLATEGVEGSEV